MGSILQLFKLLELMLFGKPASGSSLLESGDSSVTDEESPRNKSTNHATMSWLNTELCGPISVSYKTHNKTHGSDLLIYMFHT